ncbi:SAM-dependent methyltransferase [Nonomuraea sp. KC401]|uniref:SAM-dependent methyltransferase n=1 Tax=unclassified Nonomuraea TaxID=2593643 RepID=UPI0010FD7908|nr:MULTISPECIES: SAM-dependent methyltransferase [unclassified Nonomuraea]NBE94231.1 SAM-dependent methyltransferase [Nonomuraea sp. K271]TLF77884.1 SAM-dependent methyltransferase [Nonomuraea sp. KC401]
MAESEPARPPQDVDTTRPSVSRVYDYMLGGKDNYEADRVMARLALEVAPDAPQAARANREFLKRVVRHLAAEAGIRQFLDIGSGLPTQGNVHEIAQASAPGTRVVYVDNDPIVLVHGHALLAVDDTTTVVEADLREPEVILDHPEVRKLIDFGEPVGLLMLAILHHLTDAANPAGIVARMLARLPPGSHLAVSHFCNPGQAHPEVSRQAYQAEKLFNEHLGAGRWRTREEILTYFDGLEVLEPGLVPLPEWRPDPGDQAELGITYHAFVGAVARKP